MAKYEPTGTDGDIQSLFIQTKDDDNLKYVHWMCLMYEQNILESTVGYNLNDLIAQMDMLIDIQGKRAVIYKPGFQALRNKLDPAPTSIWRLNTPKGQGAAKAKDQASLSRNICTCVKPQMSIYTGVIFKRCKGGNVNNWKAT